MKLYRKKYCIGIYKKYEDDDSCITVLDNITEFAEFMGINKPNATVILNNAFRHKIDFIRWNGYKCEIVFINLK